MGIAPLIGTRVRYFEVPLNDIMIERHDGESIIINRDTFDYLYFRLGPDSAALKEDCIEYAVYNLYRPLEDYPEWYVEAAHDGWITRGCVTHFFIDYSGDGEIAMSPEAIILRNFEGRLRYMERDVFNRMYDTMGG